MDLKPIFLILALTGLTVSLLHFGGIDVGPAAIIIGFLYSVLIHLVRMRSLYQAQSILSNTTDYEKALEICNKTLANNPKNWQAYLMRANTFWFLNRREEALADLDSVDAINPKNTFTQLIRPAIHFDLAEYDKVKDAIDRAISKFEQTPHYKQFLVISLHFRASYFITQGKFEDATQDLRRMLKLDAKSNLARIGMADCLRQQGFYDGANRELDLVDRPKPRDKAHCCSQRALILLEQKRNKEALEQAKLGASILETSPPVLATYGRALFENNSYEEAERVLNKAIELHPRCGSAHWYRHQLFEAQGLQDRADSDAQTARSLGYRPAFEVIKLPDESATHESLVEIEGEKAPS